MLTFGRDHGLATIIANICGNPHNSQLRKARPETAESCRDTPSLAERGLSGKRRMKSGPCPYHAPNRGIAGVFRPIWQRVPPCTTSQTAPKHAATADTVPGSSPARATAMRYAIANRHCGRRQTCGRRAAPYAPIPDAAVVLTRNGIPFRTIAPMAPCVIRYPAHRNRDLDRCGKRRKTADSRRRPDRWTP